jgi:4-hydroxymandelate oxidase
MKTTRRQALIAATAAAAGMMAAESASAETQTKPASPDAAQAGFTGGNGAAPVCLTDYEPLAQKRMQPMAWEYINSAAADEITVRWNREAYDRIRLSPHVLREMPKLDTRCRVLGKELSFPVLLAPTALHKLAHPDGELATAKGAGDAGATMVLSTMSSQPLEDVKHVASGPVWFQLYVQKDRGFTRELVQRAKASGYEALVVTVDTPIEGARNRQQRANFRLPPGVELANLRGLKTESGKAPGTEREVFRNILPETLTWKDIEWLQSISGMPVLLKGVLNPDDADTAARMGAAGVLVSNHGGRNLDTVPATIDALPRVADKVAGRITVLVDGGVRRGTDILKAVALGANAVLIGRPVFYGLAVNGADGVRDVINILRHELEMAMALTGRDKLADVDHTALWS